MIAFSLMNGNEAGSDYRISINASDTEVWQANSAFTQSGADATLSTKITNLDQFGANPLEGVEVIEITGTDHNGNAITQVDLNITSNTKLSHLIDEINDAFDGIAIATLEQRDNAVKNWVEDLGKYLKSLKVIEYNNYTIQKEMSSATLWNISDNKVHFRLKCNYSKYSAYFVSS